MIPFYCIEESELSEMNFSDKIRHKIARKKFFVKSTQPLAIFIEI